MRQKRGLLGRFGERLDIPREILPGGFSLVLSGTRELTVSGCGRILEYSDARISLRVGKKILLIVGKDLLCAAFGGGSVTVTGEIAALVFEKRDGREN